MCLASDHEKRDGEDQTTSINMERSDHQINMSNDGRNVVVDLERSGEGMFMWRTSYLECSGRISASYVRDEDMTKCCFCKSSHSHT